MMITRRCRTCGAVVSALVMASACGGDDAPAPYFPPSDAGVQDGAADAPRPPIDKTPPTLKESVPAADDDNVWVGAPIRLVFSEPLAPATVDEQVVTLDSSAGPIAKHTTLSEDGREIRVAIDSPYIEPVELTVTVANTITDVAGNAFAGASLSFRVPLWQRPGGEAAASALGPMRPALALDANENPVVAWQDGTAIYASRLVEGKWQRLAKEVATVADGAVSALRIAVTAEDELIVAWAEAASDKHVFVKRYRDGRWEPLGAGSVDADAGREATDPVLLVGDDDHPVVAWIEDNVRVEIRRWDGNAWRSVVSAWTPGVTIADLTMALYATTPIVAIVAKDAASTEVRVAGWRSGTMNWAPVGAPLGHVLPRAVARPSLAVSRDGEIGIAWQENDGSSSNVYAAGYDESSQSWQSWDKALDVEFDAPATAPSIGFTRERTPIVAWSEEHAEGMRTYVGRFNGKRWEVPGAGFDAAGARSSGSLSLVVDSTSHPVIAWEARGNGDAGPMARVETRRYNGAPRPAFGLTERHPPPCAFPEEGAANFPRTLSETKCFSDVPGRVPSPGLIPYDVRSPLWSDGALKRRYIILPEGGTIGLMEKFSWKLPVGTILVKEFLFEREPGNLATVYPMETRFLVKRCEPGLCRAAWEGYSYQWNETGTEATLLDNTTESIFKDWPSGAGSHRHSYPGRDECRQCHANAAGGVLGLQTAQMNRNFDYGGAVDNQIRALSHIGVFEGGAVDGGTSDGGAMDGATGEDGPIDDGASDGAPVDGGSTPGGAPDIDSLPRLPVPSDPANSVNERVRSYFHSNCSHCHRPDGRWPVIDFLYDSPLVAAKAPNANICNELVPGDADASRIFIKDGARLGNLPPDFFGLPMPPLATLIADQRQLPTLKRWINEMRSCP